MKFIISTYNQDIEWAKEYSNDIVVYDRSEQPLEGTIKVDNIGTDIADKFKFIIDNYDNLPEIAVYTKANLFKYISKEEFDKVKNSKVFTPLLTQKHEVDGVINFYSEDKMYNEINNYFYLNPHPCKSKESFNELIYLLGMDKREYNEFAPGSNYLLPKENILKHPKEFYEKLRSYLMWDRYPGEAQLLERNLYYLWR